MLEEEGAVAFLNNIDRNVHETVNYGGKGGKRDVSWIKRLFRRGK